MIDDHKDEIKPIIGGGVSYSTEEQVIGTWIDGKPLYQKVIISNSLTSSDFVLVELQPNSIKEIIDVKGITNYKISNREYVVYSGISIGNSTSIGLKPSAYHISDNYLWCYLASGHGNVTKLTTIITYTKTTD